MAILYAALSLVVGLLAWRAGRRARRLQARHEAAAGVAEAARKELLAFRHLSGRGNPPDNEAGLCEDSRLQHALGGAVQVAQDVQARWEAAQTSAERWQRWKNGL